MTQDPNMGRRALKHFHAWFGGRKARHESQFGSTRAVKGKVTGRNYGIIARSTLIEVARSASLLERAGIPKGDDLIAMKKWFADYRTGYHQPV
jgi:hypothetical protein